MSSGVNNNNNNEISIQELRQKLVNVEETAYKDEATKSIFNVYNTEKSDGENSIDFLNKNELSVMINDLEKYDGRISGKADGIIDYDEAMLFVKDFNSRNKGANVNAQNLFGFVNAIFDRYNAQNSPIVETSSVKPVGDPLSQKVVQLNCMVDGKMVTIELEIDLHATNDPNFVQILIKKVTKGSEYKQILAEKYGYTGDDAWSKFTNRSLSLSASGTYEIEFNPQFASTPVDSKKDNEGNVNTSYSISVNGIDNFYFPEGFEKDPRLIYSQYQDPEVQQVMQDFIDVFRVMLEQADKNLNEYWDTYGFTAKTADFLSKIWNNDFVGGQNSHSQIKEKIGDFSKILDSMSQTGNTMEDILLHKDFGALFKELTGKDFDPKSVKEFVQARKDYLQKEAVITTYRYVHETIDGALATFASAYEAYKNPPINSIESYSENLKKGNYGQVIAQSLMMSSDPSISDTGMRVRSVNEEYKEAKDALFKVFNNFLGITSEKWDELFQEIEKKGQDPLVVLQQLAESIKTGVDTQARDVLGITDLSGIDRYEEQLKENYELTKKNAIGYNDMLDKVEKYNNSQIIGGAVVGSLIQIGMYAVGVGPLGTALSISSGLASGICYGGSYLAIEVVDRLTNGIDNSKDLFNCATIAELAGNTGVEFVAGYLFDGFLKTKIFGKGDKAALNIENSVITADVVGESALKNPMKRFSQTKIAKLLAARGFAGFVGGSKDGTKEFFKETLKCDYHLSDISAAFIFGAITNALLLRFKSSSFSKENHKILGKFIEKAPKKGVKSEIKAADSSQEEKGYNEIINSVKMSILEEIKKFDGPEREELKAFMAQNDAKMEDIIMAYYIAMYCVDDN